MSGDIRIQIKAMINEGSGFLQQTQKKVAATVIGEVRQLILDACDQAQNGIDLNEKINQVASLVNAKVSQMPKDLKEDSDIISLQKWTKSIVAISSREVELQRALLRIKTERGQLNDIFKSISDKTIDLENPAFCKEVSATIRKIVENRIAAYHKFAPDINEASLENLAKDINMAISPLLERLTGLTNQILGSSKTLPLLRQQKANLLTIYNSLQQDRVELAYLLTPQNPVESLKLKDRLEKGQVLYSVTGGDKAAAIIQGGIDLQMILESSPEQWGGLEMGKGIYFSTEGPAYLTSQMQYVIVVEVQEDMEGVSLPQRGELLSERFARPSTGQQFTDENINDGFRSVAKDENIAYLRGQGTINATELVLYRPNGKLKIKEILRGTGRDNRAGNPILKPLSMTKLLASLNRNFSISDQWAHSIEKVKKLGPKGMCLLRDSHRAKEIIFTPLIDADSKLKAEAKVAFSHFAHHLISDLAFEKRRMEWNGEQGIGADTLKLKKLPESKVSKKGHSIDTSRLTQKQINQLAAHGLVDWVLSNMETKSKDFGITEEGDIVAFNKDESCKVFNGQRAQSAAFLQGAEQSLPKEHPGFYHLTDDPKMHIHAQLREEFLQEKIKVDFNSPVIQDTIKKIGALTKKDIREFLRQWALLAFPGREDDFIQDIYDRCQDIDHVCKHFEALSKYCPVMMKTGAPLEQVMNFAKTANVVPAIDVK